VDDSEMNRDLISRRLRRQGHDVSLADNGRLALSMMRGSEFDLVLLDTVMPDVNGFDVLAQLKKDDALRHLPVIMISAAEDVDGVVRCLELGADDFLPKPCDPVVLRARVESALEKKRLRDRERVRARSLERELEIGRAIQEGFIPSELPTAAGWEIAARFEPAHQVAGDFYDAFRLGDTNRIGIVVADVCGKGVGAALFMAICRTLIHAIADRFAEEPRSRRVSRLFAPDPASMGPSGVTASTACLYHAVGATNDYIARTHGSANMFATLFFAAVDPATGLVLYVNAGHEPPVLVRGGAVAARLEPTGPALGLMADATFSVGTAPMLPGDTLVMFTDGITEAHGPRGAMLGDDRVTQICVQPAASAEEVLDHVMSAVLEHVQGAPQSDDIAMLAVRRI
jgi:serine phosphatase RsbU (regulator of sigma subunit)